jgi:hypothetical protein
MGGIIFILKINPKKHSWQKNCAVLLYTNHLYGKTMKDYNSQHPEGNEIVWIAWLIVFFSFTILYLIWHMAGYL